MPRIYAAAGRRPADILGARLLGARALHSKLCGAERDGRLAAYDTMMISRESRPTLAKIIPAKFQKGAATSNAAGMREARFLTRCVDDDIIASGYRHERLQPS